MILKEFENIEVIFRTQNQILFWSKILKFKPEIGVPVKVHWELLKTSTFRKNNMVIKCDCCGVLFNKNICNVNNDKPHYCVKCRNKGERNGMYGKPISESLVNGRNKLFEERGNPFTWESTKKKNKEINVWAKIGLKNKGRKRSEITKIRLSNSIKLAYKEGRLKPNKRWGNVLIKKYNGIEYQSSYELNFIKHCESLGIINLIKRGPKINYLDLKGDSHIYYSDYIIDNTDIVIEIKSSYFWLKNLDINEQKKIYTEKLYNYILIIDNDFKPFDKLINTRLNI